MQKANAQFFEGDNAPRYVTLAIEAIDNRLPSQEDARSWLPLLAKYNFRSLTEPIKGLNKVDSRILLERSSAPWDYKLVPIREENAKLGEKIAVPPVERGAVWVTMHLHQTNFGKAKKKIYKLPPVYLELDEADGNTSTYRLIPPVAESGFLLSPVVLRATDFHELSTHLRGGGSPPAEENTVKSLRVLVHENLQSYQPEIRISFSNLMLEKPSDSVVTP